MTTRVETIIAEIHTDSGLVALGVGTGVYGYGLLDWKVNRSPPYISWIDMGGTVGPPVPPDGCGGRYVTGDTQRSRAVATDFHLCTVLLWGADAEAAEDIKHAFINACWRKAGGSVAFSDWEWSTERDPDYAQAGSLIQMKVRLSIPVVEETKTLTVLTDQDHTAIFNGPNHDVTTHSP